MPTVFDGQFIVQPQAKVRVDDSKLANLNPGAQNILALLGVASAGLPQQAVLIQDPTTARRLLRSGDLLDAALLAFDPSAQTGGASSIFVVRVNSALAAKAKVLDAAGAKATGTVTVAGTWAAGQTLVITIGGVAVSYTVQAGDTNLNGTAASFASAINATPALQDGLTGVTAYANAAIINIVARSAGVDGNSITLTSTPAGAFTLACSGGTLSTGTGNTLFTLIAKDYGIYTNQIYFKFAAGTASGFKATFGLTTTGNILGGSVTQDNIARPLLTLRYTGGAATCTATVNDTALTITSATAGENETIQFATYTKVQDLADYLNSKGYFTATVSAGAGAFLTASQFDKVTAQDVKAANYTFNGNLAALIDFINSPAVPFVGATRATNPAAVAPYYSANNQYLTGGSEGTSTTQDWTNALAALQNVDCQIVVPVTESAAIHAAALTHVNYMSTAGRKPRVAVCGGALGEYSASAANPVGTIVARAQALNTDRVMLVSPGIQYYDVNQALQTKSSAFTAALVGGMLAAVAPGTPLTHKYVSNVVALETVYTPSDVDTLLMGGIAALQYVQNKGFRIAQSCTTWLVNENFAHTEISTRMAIDTVARRVQDALDELVGEKIAPETISRAISTVETVLKQAQNDGLIVGDKNSPAFSNITASTGSGDTINVSFQISPAIPANYILVTISTVPYVGSAGTAA